MYNLRNTYFTNAEAGALAVMCCDLSTDKP
jgi:hypothetical protein